MEEEAIWGALSTEEHRSVWDETERKFWPTFRKDQDVWRGNAEQKHNAATTGLRMEIGNLAARRGDLTDTHARLTRELAKVEEDLRRIAGEHDAKSNSLAKADQEYREELEAQVDKWKVQSRTMVNFFRQKRGESQLSEAEAVEMAGSLCQAAAAAAAAEAAVQTAVQSAEAKTAATKALETVSKPPELPENVMVNAVDADGNVIGPVERIEPWNQWVDAVQKLPIRRPVLIRRGRRFHEEHLASIYERSESKGVKWLSCMIQATGTVQSRRCASCEKNQGAFEQCIIVGGELFPKCGNCEWNRQGCHGASGEVIDVDKAQLQKKEAEEFKAKREQKAHAAELQPRPLPPSQAPAHLLRHAQAQINRPDERPHVAPMPFTRAQSGVPEPARRDTLPPIQSAPQSDRWRDVVISDVPADRRLPPLMNAPERKESLPNELPGLNGHYIREPVQQLPTPLEPRDYPITGGFKAANASARNSRPPSRDLPTPTRGSAEQSPQPTQAEEDLDDINRSNLVLRHNGVVYTWPECMVGVPMAKIDERHPYWDPTWRDVRLEITEARERWKQKQELTLAAEARNEKTGSTKYQIGRQVNRGTKILEFLELGEISPYQLLGKRYMHSSKGGITSYDTLFRLCETLSELSKFNLDIAPIDWMRHRLWELMTAKGKGFNLAKTVHDFYHDPKLAALRSKHGFKNIGRPSGGGRPSIGSTNGGTPRAVKRKTPPVGEATPQELAFVDQSQQAVQLPQLQQLPQLGRGPQLSQSPQLSHVRQMSDGPQLRRGSQANQSPYHSPPQVSQKHEPVPDSPPAKRTRLSTSTPQKVRSNLPAEDFSDTDSMSGAPIYTQDWRLLQVKTKQFTSSTKLTQYWQWKKDQRVLEHHVLKDEKPIEWKVLKDPMDLSVRLDQVAQVFWNNQAMLVYFRMDEGTGPPVRGGRGRGDIMAGFKRERTMKRFLRFCREMKMDTEEMDTAEIQGRWKALHGEEVTKDNV